MIVVPIDLWKQGNADDTKDLGTVLIWNTGGTREIGEYEWCILKMGARLRNRHLLDNPTRIPRSDVWCSGVLFGFQRLRLGGADLLFQVLRSAVSRRNP